MLGFSLAPTVSDFGERNFAFFGCQSPDGGVVDADLGLEALGVMSSPERSSCLFAIEPSVSDLVSRAAFPALNMDAHYDAAFVVLADMLLSTRSMRSDRRYSGRRVKVHFCMR